MDGKLRTLLLEYERKRTNAESRSESRVKEIYKKYPRLAEIEEERSRVGLKAMRLTAYGLDGAKSASEFMKSEFERLRKEENEICALYNIPEDYKEVKYECDMCKDRGVLDEGGKCKCLEQKIIEICYDRSNMKNLLVTQNFDMLDMDVYSDLPGASLSGMSQKELMKENIKLSKMFIENVGSNNGKSLVFQGKSGTGKTYLSSCIANEVIRKGKTVVYKPAGDIVKLVSKMQFGGDYSSEVVSEYNNLLDCDLLIIDDLGTEMVTKFVVSELYTIINSRIISGKKFIISTNLSTNELDKSYTSRIVYRLIESCSFLEFAGANLRVNKYVK